MIKLIGSRKSRSFRVLWALEEMAISFEHLSVGPHDPAVLEHSRHGAVPVMLDGDAALTDSVAIMSYLSDRTGRLGAAAGTVERAQLDALLHRINEQFDALLWMAARHSFILPQDERVPGIKDSLKRDFTRNANRLAEDLGEKPFLMGDAFTIADILLVHCLGWSVIAKFPKVEAENLRDYFDRMTARPAYQRARNYP